MLDNPEEMDKFAKIKSQVADVKGIMQGNIQKVIMIFSFHFGHFLNVILFLGHGPRRKTRIVAKQNR